MNDFYNGGFVPELIMYMKLGNKNKTNGKIYVELESEDFLQGNS